MSNKILALTDYNTSFESRYDAFPYRSGMDKDMLASEFFKKGYSIDFKFFYEVEINELDPKTPVLYTSKEDYFYSYKDFIEDIVLAIELKGCKIIPSFPALRANNNKVFMELVRNTLLSSKYKTKKSWVFGGLEELKKCIFVNYPLIVKDAKGAQSRGVSIAYNEKELHNIVKKMNFHLPLKERIREFVREKKYPGYKSDDKFPIKFIVQEFIPELLNDYKVLVYGDKYYILKRGIKAGDFRASGSRTNYHIGEESIPPTGIFDYAKKLKELLKVPNLSADIAFDGEFFHLIEFQCIFFGSYTQLFSKCYFTQKNLQWEAVYETINLEKLYADSIINFIENGNK
jgi:hypothetical protein